MCAKDDVYVKYDSLKVQTKLCLEIHCLCISLAFVFGRDVIVGMQKREVSSGDDFQFFLTGTTLK